MIHHMKKRGARRSSGGLVFLLILIILAMAIYLYYNQILGYLENNQMFQTIENITMQFINESQQAFNIIQNSLNGNISINNLYTSNNQNNTNTLSNVGQNSSSITSSTQTYIGGGSSNGRHLIR
jgi:hypothetical protein